MQNHIQSMMKTYLACMHMHFADTQLTFQQFPNCLSHDKAFSRWCICLNYFISSGKWIVVLSPSLTLGTRKRGGERKTPCTVSVLTVNQLVLQELVTDQIWFAVYATVVNQLFNQVTFVIGTKWPSGRIMGRLWVVSMQFFSSGYCM